MASNMMMISVALIFSFSACCEGFATSVPLLRKIGSADRSGSRCGGVHLSMMRHEGVHRKKVISAGIATVAGLLAPHGVQAVENSAQWAVHEGPFADSEFSSFSETPSGLRYKDIVVGDGNAPTPTDTVRCHYVGYTRKMALHVQLSTAEAAHELLCDYHLLTLSSPIIAVDGRIFDKSYGQALFPFSLFMDSSPPIAFKLKGGLIPGFSEGILGMKVGGKRILSLKPELAYGKVGVKGVIAPDSTLVFYVELRAIGEGAML